jgi:hypothetical protein
MPFSRSVVVGKCNKLDWVIVGGESGPSARPCNPEWIRLLRRHCEETGTPLFFKQWGEWLFEGQLPGAGFTSLPKVPERWTTGGFLYYRVGKRRAGRALDGVEIMEWPGGGVQE